MAELPCHYVEYTEREFRKPRLAEEYFTEPVTPKVEKQKESPVSLLDTTFSYLSNLQIRIKLWTLLCQKPSVHIFRSLFGPLHLPEPHQESFWLLANSIHYNISDVKGFFETLMELAVEEKTRFHSFATARNLRPWIQDSHLTDKSLVRIYLCIRDGERYLREQNA